MRTEKRTANSEIETESESETDLNRTRALWKPNCGRQSISQRIKLRQVPREKHARRVLERREPKPENRRLQRRREIYDGQVCALSLSFEQLIASASPGKLISAQMFTAAATSTPRLAGKQTTVRTYTFGHKFGTNAFGHFPAHSQTLSLDWHPRPEKHTLTFWGDSWIGDYLICVLAQALLFSTRVRFLYWLTDFWKWVSVKDFSPLICWDFLWVISITVT